MGSVVPASTYLRSFCPRELLLDILIEYARVGRRERVHWWTGRRCPKHVVQLIFDLCVSLQVGLIEKYAAVELFERFVQEHVKSVRKDLYNACRSPEARSQTRGNLQKQAFLRIVSCIIIVHKFHSPCHRLQDRHRLFMDNCLKMIKVVAPKCTHEILIRSEFRVLQVSVSSGHRASRLTSRSSVLAI